MKTLMILLFLSSLFIFSSCGGNEQAVEENTTDTTTTATTTEEPKEEPGNDPNTFNAKFVDFEFGDASHFLFEDEAGNQWDFGSSMVTNYTFEAETEEGFGPNAELQGKTFKIKYVTKEQPLYPDGPIGEVKVIVEATLVE